MKPHIKLSRGYWVCTIQCGQLAERDWYQACRFVNERNLKEGRWPGRLTA